MTTLINVRALRRGTPTVRINGTVLSSTADVSVDLDVAQTRKDLHSFLGQWVVSGNPSEDGSQIIIPIANVDTAGGMGSWTNTLGFSAMVQVSLITTVVASGVCTLSAGNAASATTLSATSISGQDVHSATVNLAGKPVVVPANGFFTVSTASGASAGLVGKVYLMALPS